jgi:hypothetical protein
MAQRYASGYDPTIPQLRTSTMRAILTCTWAPTAMAVPKLTKTSQWVSKLLATNVQGEQLQEQLLRPVRLAERLGIDHLLVAQRWWGTGEEIEGSTYDCVVMTAFYAAHTERIRLITAIHPGFSARSNCEVGRNDRSADRRPLVDQCHLRMARSRVWDVWCATSRA